MLADVAAPKASGQNADNRQDIKFKDLEKRLYDLEQKLNSKVTEELTEAEYRNDVKLNLANQCVVMLRSLKCMSKIQKQEMLKK